jgi:uncharacterized protein with NRDE domain
MAPDLITSNTVDAGALSSRGATRRADSMCLLTIAHLASESFPLVIAANRDEDYDRATHDAHAWPDAPDVVGGRDGLHGGTWLAVRRGGRYAAVTNLRGAERRAKSRGFLVSSFVTGDASPLSYAESIARDADQYAGFHLLAGNAGQDLMYIAPETQVSLGPGVHAFSNAPVGEEWPKVKTARDAVQKALELDRAELLVDELMRFLCMPRGTGSVESEVFVSGDRYGTRSSTVVAVTPSEILFAEQSYGRRGARHGERRLFCLVR